jgi:hypothetical protein
MNGTMFWNKRIHVVWSYSRIQSCNRMSYTGFSYRYSVDTDSVAEIHWFNRIFGVLHINCQTNTMATTPSPPIIEETGELPTIKRGKNTITEEEVEDVITREEFTEEEVEELVKDLFDDCTVVTEDVVTSTTTPNVSTTTFTAIPKLDTASVTKEANNTTVVQTPRTIIRSTPSKQQRQTQISTILISLVVVYFCLSPFSSIIQFVVNMIRTGLTVAGMIYIYRTTEDQDKKVIMTVVCYIVCVFLIWMNPILAIQLVIVIALIHMFYSSRFVMYESIVVISISLYSAMYITQIYLGFMTVVLGFVLIGLLLKQVKTAKVDLFAHIAEKCKEKDQTRHKRKDKFNLKTLINAFTKKPPTLPHTVTTRIKIHNYYIFIAGTTNRFPDEVTIGILGKVYSIPLFLLKKKQRVPSAYQLFCRNELGHVMENSHSEVVIAKDIINELTRRWTQLDPKDKEIYYNQAKDIILNTLQLVQQN